MLPIADILHDSSVAHADALATSRFFLAVLDERYRAEASGTRAHGGLAFQFDVYIELRGLDELSAVARLSNQLAAEGRADNANGLGRFLRDAAALYGVRGGQKSVDLARDDGRELEHCRDVRI